MKGGMDYKESGVDKERGYQLVHRIRQQSLQNAAKLGSRANVLGGIGGFASLYALNGYREPVLVSGTDGVGTKLKLAFDLAHYDALGQDCVAMCVNDILCSGAEPLFFLDYLACERLDVEIAAALVGSITRACESIGIPLLGGETAEMPGFYRNGLYDMAGFCLGAVERSELRGPQLSRPGDLIVGLGSSGLHSNGFSLVRKVLERCERNCGPIDYQRPLAGPEGPNLREALLLPTTLYTPILPRLRQWGDQIHSMAHITGGGIYENLPRALGEGLCAEVERTSIRTTEIFDFVRNPARYLNGSGAEGYLISEEEMWHTFNMGLGFAIIATEEAALDLVEFCRGLFPAGIIGHVVPMLPQSPASRVLLR